jgi:hypothetical protein
MMNKRIALCVLGLAMFFMVGGIAAAAEPVAATPTPPSPEKVTTLQNVQIKGTLDLDNGVPIRWKKPDGTGYVNIFRMDKNGTLQLCPDPFFFDQPRQDLPEARSDAPKDREQRIAWERQHDQRVIEVRNPKSAYPDLRLPFTRTHTNGKAWDADSKLMARSATFVETNDPAEINLIRTGDDAKPVNDENAPVKDGAVTGILRFMGRSSKADPPGVLGGYAKDVEIVARNYGTAEANHYGALMFAVADTRYKNVESAVMLVMRPGVRIADANEKMAGVSGGMLEVDSQDDRPVILRRENASTTRPVALALASGKNGTAADANNSLAVIKASPQNAANPHASRVEIQTNKGGRLESDWVLPVPAAEGANQAGQKIPSGQPVTLAFGQCRYDTDSIFQADEPTRLTCRTAGRYLVSAAVEFSANAKGSRQVIVRRNGREQVAAMRVPAVDGETTQITFTAPPIDLKPGDYVELLVRQTSGRVLEVQGNAELPLKFGITRAG